MRHEETIPYPVAAVCLGKRLLGALGQRRPLLSLSWTTQVFLSPLLVLCQASLFSVIVLAMGFRISDWLSAVSKSLSSARIGTWCRDISPWSVSQWVRYGWIWSALLPGGSNKDWGNPGSGACRDVMGGQ